MSAPQKFRSAFNGFNREDVVHYLEYLNGKHTAQVNQLTSELEYLRARLDSVPAEAPQDDAIAALEQERDELRAQVESLTLRCEELEQKCAAGGPADELETYRRAERTERMARERADLIHRKANGVLTEASVRVNDAAAQITPAADQLLAQLNQLQTAILQGRQSLQDAAIILGTLHCDEP